MATREELIEEAKRRGLIKSRDQQIREEAERRGLAVPAQPQSVLEGMVDAFTQGATFGFGDELTALEAATLGRTPEGQWFQYDEPFERRYYRALESERAQNRQFAQDRPVLATGTEIAGAMVPVVGTMGAATAPTLMGNVGRAMTQGAITGGLYGAGVAEGDAGEIAEGIMKGGATGAVTAGALSTAGGRIAQAFKNRRFKAQAPTEETLKAGSRAAFKTAEQQGVVFKGEAVNLFDDVLQAEMKQAGFHPRLHPRVAATLDEIASARNADLTLENLTLLRRIAQSAGRSIDNPDEGRLAGIIVDAIDDLVDNVPVSGLVSGDSAKASAALRTARKMWSTVRKSELLSDAFERAQRQATGFENGLRIQFRQILNNPRKARSFTKDERALMDKVVKGGKTENILKLIGKFSFGRGQATNMLGGTIGAGLGAAAGGTPGAIAAAGAASTGRRAAEAATRASAELTDAAVRAGRMPAPVVFPGPVMGGTTGLAGYTGGVAAEPPVTLEALKRRAGRVR